MRYCLQLLVCLFLFVPFALLGQSKDVLERHGDSLYTVLQKMDDGDQKAHALLDLSFFWSDYDTTRAFLYIQQASHMLAEKTKADYYLGILSFYRASTYFDNDPEKAKKQYMLAEASLKKAKDTRASRYRVRLWGSYGALLQREGKAHEYVEVLLTKVIPMAKAIGDSLLLGNNYQNVAMSLMNLQQYVKADTYYTEALHILRGRQAADEQRLTVFVNAARNALFQKKMPQARDLLDSASTVVRLLPFSSYVPMYYSVEGSYWQKNGSLDRSLKHFEKGLEVARRLKSDDLVTTILYDQYEAYTMADHLPQALEKLLEVLPYVERKPLLRNKQMTYYNLAHLETLLGNFKNATGWFEKYKLMTDAVFENAGEARTLELEKKYQTAEKENELLHVKAEHQQQQLSLQRTRGLAIILMLICAVLGMLSFIWYSAMRNRKHLAIQKELLLQEELKNLRQREKLSLFNAMVQGQEKERSRIARDLHDGLGGMLASVKLKLSAVANRNEMEKKQKGSSMELYNIINQLDHSVNELRAIARNMMPESLLYIGLEASLRDLCKAMEHPDLRIDFEATQLEKDYPQSFLIAIYRIVQELLTNAVKHSEATHIWVQCSENEEHFYLSVEDNGKGFNYKEVMPRAAGIGLSNIQNRVEILNGSLEIDAVPGKGSSFHINIDLHG